MALRQKVYKIESFIAGGESAGDMQGASAAAVVSGSSIDSRTILDELRAIRRMVEPTSEITSKTIESFKAELAEAHKIRAELEEIYAAIERTKQEIATLHTTGFKGAQMVRVTGELDAIVQGTLEATDQILTAAESIDRDAGLLEAAVKSEQDRALASDIQ